jgi:hypothetical protein
MANNKRQSRSKTSKSTINQRKPSGQPKKQRKQNAEAKHPTTKIYSPLNDDDDFSGTENDVGAPLNPKNLFIDNDETNHANHTNKKATKKRRPATTTKAKHGLKKPPPPKAESYQAALLDDSSDDTAALIALTTKTQAKRPPVPKKPKPYQALKAKKTVSPNPGHHDSESESEPDSSDDDDIMELLQSGRDAASRLGRTRSNTAKQHNTNTSDSDTSSGEVKIVFTKKAPPKKDEEKDDDDLDDDSDDDEADDDAASQSDNNMQILKNDDDKDSDDDNEDSGDDSQADPSALKASIEQDTTFTEVTRKKSTRIANRIQKKSVRVNTPMDESPDIIENPNLVDNTTPHVVPLPNLNRECRFSLIIEIPPSTQSWPKLTEIFQKALKYLQTNSSKALWITCWD